MTDVDIRMTPDLGAVVDDIGERLSRGLQRGVEASTMLAGDLMRAEVPRRSGRLADAISTRIDGDQGAVDIDAPHARLQDAGGEIRGRPLLRVPISPAARAGRISKSLFTVKTRRGRLILAERTRAGIRPHFLLLESVKVRGQGFVKRTARRLQAAIAELVAAHIRTELERGGT